MKKYTFSQLPESIRKGIIQSINDMPSFVDRTEPHVKNYLNKLKEQAEKSTYIYTPDFPVNLLEFRPRAPNDYRRMGNTKRYDALMHYIDELKSGKKLFPIIITEGDYKLYYVVNGIERLDAMLYLNRKTVPTLMIEWW